jgi:hypothetical protein
MILYSIDFKDDCFIGVGMRVFVKALLFTILCAGIPAFGQQYSVLGQGNESCGTWSVDRQSGQGFGEEAWVLGSLSGQDSAAAFVSKKTVTVNTDSNGVFGWIDNYCKINPTDTIASAAIAFWGESSTIKLSGGS